MSGAGSSHCRARLGDRCCDDRCTVELDDLERPGDRSTRLDHERQTAVAAFSRDPEESMQGRAVDEEDAVQVDHERSACSGRTQLLHEVVRIAQVDVTRDGDDRYLIDILY